MATVNLRDPFGFTKSLLFVLCKLRDTRNNVRARKKIRVLLMVDARPEGFERAITKQHVLSPRCLNPTVKLIFYTLLYIISAWL